MRKPTLNDIFRAVHLELAEATEAFPPFASNHEGYAVLKEEVDELWEAIKDKSSNASDISDEAHQVAAMAIRLILDMKGVPDGRPTEPNQQQKKSPASTQDEPSL